MKEHQFRDPVRPVRMDLVANLVLEDAAVYPLPGGAFVRGTDPDPRLVHLKEYKLGDKVLYYEHIATVKDRSANLYYVIFRETMDALLARQKNPELFPEWLMKHSVKKTERRIFVYLAYRHPKLVPGGVQVFTDWLQHVEDETTQDAIFYFLLRNNVITEEMYGTSK